MKKFGIIALVLAVTMACTLTGCMNQGDMAVPTPKVTSTPKVTATVPDATDAPAMTPEASPDMVPGTSPDVSPDMMPDSSPNTSPESSPEATTKPSEAN